MNRRVHLLPLSLLLGGALAAAAGKLPAFRPITTLAAIPEGLTLPVALTHSLRAGRSPVAQPISVVTTQRILLPGNLFLPAGAHLVGTLEQSSTAPDTLTLRFSSLRFHGQTVPIFVRTLALANFTDVSDTALPAQGSTDRGNSDPASWTTQQIGGDQVVRSGWSGPVVNSTTETGGFADFSGVYALPAPGSDVPHSLGVFSASARGLYGKADDCTLLSAAAALTVTCATSHLVLRPGDSLLLQVLPTPAGASVTP